jgi:pterin-4a-carbinolamine dehydratase/uncharacterized protein (DUF2267 family)
VLEYQAFVQAVGRHLGVSDTAELKAAIEAVLGAVDQFLDADARGRLVVELPGSLRPAVGTASATQEASTREFVAIVGSLGGYTDQRARYVAQAVLAAVAELDPAAADVIRPALPDETLMAPLGQGPAPAGSAVATRRQPEILSLEEIQRFTAGATGWTGDEAKLVRTVDVPAERVDPLRQAVRRIESELDHHAQVDNGPGGLTFTVWTHTLSRVTDLDIQLAQRIDEAIGTAALD